MENYNHLTRQLDILPPEYVETPVTIIGAGAIGSMVAFGLAKCGFADMTVYDDDKVSVENRSCSIYRKSDVDKPKVQALQEIVKDFSDIDIKAFDRRFNDAPVDGILISAVDSMKSRQSLWTTHRKSKDTILFIDPRMSAEDGLIYAIDPRDDEDIEVYEKTLHSDDDGVQERCTAKATMYTSLNLPGQVIKTLKSFLTRKEAYERITIWSIRHSDLTVFKKEFKK